MKLIRFGEQGKEKPKVIQDDKWFDVSQFVKCLNYAKHARETNAVIPKAYSIFQINNVCFRTK
jgi:hypothetical protein